MASQAKHLYHPGVKSVKRSTLAYANSHRSSDVFKSMFETMLGIVSREAPRHKFRFKNDLYSIDATTVIVVRNGKGFKDRIMVLPETVILDLTKNLARTKALHLSFPGAGTEKWSFPAHRSASIRT